MCAPKSNLCLEKWSPHLHANDGVDEEEHDDQDAHVGQGPERLHECPEEEADCVALAEQFDEACRPEQPQEADVD